MKPHAWKVVEYDGGHMGVYSVFECAVCGATGSGFPDLGQEPHGWFYANGSGLKLTDDCDESKRLIEAFELGALRPDLGREVQGPPERHDPMSLRVARARLIRAVNGIRLR